MIITGDADLGWQLLQKSTKYLNETMPAVDTHADSAQHEICYLTVGDKENALLTLETKLAHNLLNWWE